MPPFIPKVYFQPRLEANRQKLTLRVSLPALEAKHSARRPGLGAGFAFGTSVDLKKKALLQCSLNYNYITQAPPIPTYRVKKVSVTVTF